MDYVGSTAALVFLAPVFLLLATCIKLSEPGAPALFVSPRIGQSGDFGALKFRTMRVGAAAQLDDLLANDPASKAEYEEFGKLRSDPRVTRLGRILRSTSLDELPQFVNVHRGEMSLVGPRPKLPTERERFGVTLDPILLCRPGLTGLWQVSGRSEATFDERIELDVIHVARASMGFDIRILLQTVAMLCRPGRQGAY